MRIKVNPKVTLDTRLGVALIETPKGTHRLRRGSAFWFEGEHARNVFAVFSLFENGIAFFMEGDEEKNQVRFTDWETLVKAIEAFPDVVVLQPRKPIRLHDVRTPVLA